MCGLAGVMSHKLNPHEIETFSQLMTLSTFRGRWGAGVTVCDKQNKLHSIKTLSTGINLVYGQKFFDMTVKKDIKILSGHCRWPTKGSSEDLEDVHPHQHKHIIGVHNGTMTRVNNVYLDNKVSDSRELIKGLAEHGVQKTIDDSWGAYALAWFDTNAKTFNFLRNNERPLFIGWPKASKATIFWASEEDFLQFVLGRRYVGDIITEAVPIHTLITYALKIPNGEINPVSKTEVKRNYPIYSGRSRWQGDNEGVFGGEVIPFRGHGHSYSRFDDDYSETYETERGYFIPKARMAKLLGIGCAWCTMSGTFEELKKKTYTWVSASEYLCQECSKDNEVKALTSLNFGGLQ